MFICIRKQKKKKSVGIREKEKVFPRKTPDTAYAVCEPCAFGARAQILFRFAKRKKQDTRTGGRAERGTASVRKDCWCSLALLLK